jgi:non-specific serine/threonine protein kinase/serine/threonine-protein kinase
VNTDADKEIFADALELPAFARRAFVEERCAGDAERRDRVLGLLDAHERAEAFMGAPTLADPPTGPGPSPEAPELGMSLGPYRLELLLGEGGFGRVYLARQERPVERVVAVKILKPDAAGGAWAARLESERRVLARMDHPGIATIFDAGRTPDGRPYFAMEFVRGEAITYFCRRAGLSVRDRLELFERVCLAVHHAHQKGIIHRDLKPSNVLVTVVDGAPGPKVIDFGIAKAMEEENGNATLLTQAGHLLGTPAYMSPEQIAGVEGIDTRSDVYALGVMLYEMLTGVLPFDDELMRRGGLPGIARMIAEQTPARPSTRVLTSPEFEDADERRRASATLRGDLDWIVLRAMEKDPDRRYASAEALARDIRRSLRDEPVEAGPPGAAYRLAKFARRHRGEVIAGGVALAALVALFVSTIVYGLSAESQRREIAVQLERSRGFASFIADMLSGIDPAIARGADRTLIRRMLDDAVARADREPPASPEVEAEIRELLGTGLFKIAAFEEAAKQFGAARDAATGSFGPDHPTTLRIRAALAQIHAELSRFEDAGRELASVLEARRRTLGPDHPDTLFTEYTLGLVLRLRGDFPAARAMFDSVAERRTTTLGPDHPDTLAALNSLATVLNELGESGASIAMLEKVVAGQRRSLGEDHPHTLATRNNLAQAYAEAGRVEESIAVQEAVLETKRRVLEPTHPSLITSLNNLASAYRTIGREAESLAMFEQALEVSREAFSERDQRTLILTSNLAGQLVRSGHADRGLDILAPALTLSASVLGEDHPLTLAMLAHSARALLALGQHADALGFSTVLIERAEHAPAFDARSLAEFRLVHAEALLRAGESGAASELLHAARDSFRSLSPPPADRIERCDALLDEVNASRTHAGADE